VPMGVGVLIPTKSLSGVKDTTKIVVSITDAESVTTEYDKCTVLNLDLSSDSHFEPNVRYVQMTDNAFDGTYSIGDWEDEIMESHTEILNMSATYSKWNRYLDTHLGVLYTPSDGDYSSCTSDVTEVKALIDSSDADFKYAPREDEGVHFYVGTPGIKSWEFNVYNCDSEYTNICGCEADNNLDEYAAETGAEECPHT
jgi:hypothetical protein